MKVVSWRKVRVVVFRIFVILFVSTTFGHNLHRIEPKICGCEQTKIHPAPRLSILPYVITYDNEFWRQIMNVMTSLLEHCAIIDLFRGACAVKGNVQVAGHVKPAPFSRRDVTLGDVDGSIFHIKIWFFIGHHDQYGHNWGNISQFAMWLSQSSVYIYKNWSVNVPISAFGCQIWQSYE